MKSFRIDSDTIYVSITNVKQVIRDKAKGELKEIGFVYNYKTYEWEGALDQNTCNFLMRHGYVPVGEAYNVLKGVTYEITPRKPIPFPDKYKFPEKARQYQIEAVKTIYSKGNQALVSLPAGSGKTLVISTWLGSLETKYLPAVIICPASLKEHWVRELWRWADLRGVVINAGDPFPNMRKYDAVIINYDIVGRYVKQIADTCHTIVCDESHALIGNNSQRTKYVKALSRNMLGKVYSSATPLNRPINLYPVLNMLAPETFKDYTAYKNRYCGPKKGFGGHITYNGASNIEELHNIVKNFIIYRSKEEILPELPKKQYIKYNLTVSKELVQAYADADNAPATERLARIQALTRTAYAEKREWIFDYVDRFLEDTEDKIVLFAHHTSVFDDLMDRYGDISVGIDGRTKVEDRQGNVDKFLHDKKIRVFIGNDVAAGVGFSLTSAWTTVFTEFSIQPNVMTQAIERTHRITSTSPHVEYIFPIALDTIEMQIVSSLDAKSEVASVVLTGEKVDFFGGAEEREE